MADNICKSIFNGFVAAFNWFKSILISIFFLNYSRTENGPSGLRNNDETCYMNSMIQALASSAKLLDTYNDLSKKTNCEEMFQLFQLLWNINNLKNNDGTLHTNTKQLKDLIEKVGWDKSSQQDTFQMLSFFISAIEKKLKKCSDERTILPPKFQMLHSFSENASFNKIQTHLAIALPLSGDYSKRPGVRITSLLDSFFLPSVIDDGPHQTSINIFGEAPEVLIIHIQANIWSDQSGMYVKPEYYIIYDEQLKYSFKIYNCLDDPKGNKTVINYKLTAVVHHMGTVEGGHYVTYRRHGSEWYLANDKQVEEINFRCEYVPYVMVYEKM